MSAKRIVDEEMRFNIVINGNSAQKELYDLEKANKKLTNSNKDLRAEQARLVSQGKKNSQEYKNLSAQIKANNSVINTNKNRMKALQTQLGVTGLSMSQLRKKASMLRLQLNNMIPGSAKYKALENELKKVNAQITKLNFNSRATKGTISKMADGFNKYSALGATVLASVTGIVFTVQKLIGYQKQLSDAQSDVQKTTGMTKKEVEDLMNTFTRYETRTSKIDLLKIAEEGGRIGIAKEELADFVQVMDKAVVALGDSFPGGVEETASKLGKLKLLFKETKNQRVDEAYNAIGSAINELGANGVATESNIADFATRVGSLPDSLKPSIADALALGAAFEESGIQSEIAGRAYSIVLSQASEKSEKFAQVMGLTKNEVEELINTNPLEFMIQFSKGLDGMNATETANTLKYLGISADGARKVLGAMSNNTDRFRELLDLSNKSLKEGTSLTNEFNVKNNNLAATLEKIQKKLLGTFNSKKVTDGLNTMLTWFGKLIGAVKTHTDTIEKERLELFKLQSRIFSVNTTTEERVKLINQLKNDYPDLLKNIDAEKVSNEELKIAIKAVNDQLINRILIAREQDKIDAQNEKTADRMEDFIEQQDRLREAVAGVAQDMKDFSFDDSKTEYENAIALANKWVDVNGKSTSVIKQVGSGYYALKNAIESYRQAQDNLNYSQNQGNQLLTGKEELMKRLGITDTNTNTNNGTTKTDEEDDVKSVFTTPSNEKKTVDLVAKTAEELQKLRETSQDNKIKLLQESYEKEVELENLMFERKISSLDKQKVSQEEIDKAISEGNNKLASLYIDKNKELDKQIEQEEMFHLDRMQNIYSNHITISLQKFTEQFQKEEELRQIKQNEELAALGNDLEARKALEDKFKREALQREKEHQELLRQELLKVVDTVQNLEDFDIELLSEDQKQLIIDRLQALGLKISEINNLLAQMSGKSTGNKAQEELNGLGFGNGLDILGMSQEQWQQMFTNTETLAGSLGKVVNMVGAATEAYRLFAEFQSASENRRLQQFEQNANKEKAKLKTLYDNKFLTQKQYDDAVRKIDEDLDKKKAEIAYKQAKRERQMAIANIALNTAQAIMSIWAQVPKADFGVTAGILTAFVTALGGLQLATVLKTPLPAKGYESGYYGKMPIRREQDGKMFNAEFGGMSRSGVVDKPTLFLAGEQGKNFPEMIIDGRTLSRFNPELKDSLYRELGRVRGFENGYYKNDNYQVPEENNEAMLIVLNRAVSVLEKLEQNGVIAHMSRDFNDIRRLRDRINELEKAENKANIG